ncbi:MAG: helix-turn-helix transcriptional regulator [Fimbriimonadaceae bacterium]|nr:helix-turn-helix transcriptional regulator [Fimbriimonadaceae bacterium]QYK55533.1 MAG: helix-turn-helix transcriptional regulator [Fimbriimonadaceae bacterium]
MPNQVADFDSVFQALANPTRRGVLERLALGSAAMTELAKPFDMALPSFLQHLQVLEQAGLVASEKRGRSRVFQLRPQPIAQAEGWLAAHRRQWEARLDRLDAFLKETKNQ